MKKKKVRNVSMSMVTNLCITMLAWCIIRGIASSGASLLNFTPQWYDSIAIGGILIILSHREKIPELLERVQRWCYHHYKLILVSATLITIPLFMGIFKLQVQPVFDGDLPKDNPKVVSYEKYETLKDEHTFVLTVYSDEGMLNLKGLKMLEVLEKRAEEFPGVNPDTVLSLRNIRAVIPIGNGVVDINKLIDHLNDIDDDAAREKELQEVVRNHPLAYGRLISESEHVATIQVRYDPKVDRKGLHRQSMKLIEEFKSKYPEYQFGVAGFDILEQQIMVEIIFMAVVLSIVAVILMIVFLSYSFGVFREGTFNHSALSGVLFAMGPLTLFPAIWVMGGLGWIGIPIDTVSAVIPIVFIAVASSYGVHTFYHITHAPFEENEGRVMYGCNKVARALFTSSATTAIGFATLAPFAVESIKKFGLFSALGIMLMLVVAYLCTPAWFAMWPASKVEKGDETKPVVVSGFLWFSKAAINNPIVTLLLLIPLMGILGIKATSLHVGSAPTKFLKKGDTIRQTSELLTDEFGANGALFIAVETGKENKTLDPEVLEKIQGLAEFLSKQPAVAFVQHLAEEEVYLNERYAEQRGLPKSMKLSSQLMLAYEIAGENSQYANFDKSTAFMIAWGDYSNSRNVDEIYGRIYSYAKKYEMKVTVGSEYVLWSAQTDYIVRGKIVSWAQSLLLIFLLGWLVFRSWFAGVMITCPLVIAITIILGTMSLAGISLDIASTVITSITIGVGADYAIHVYSGILQESNPNVTKRLVGVLEHSAPPIIFDGLSDVIGFSVFTLSALQPVAHCGWMLVIGMCAACAGALVIVPLLAKIKPPTQPT